MSSLLRRGFSVLLLVMLPFGPVLAGSAVENLSRVLQLKEVLSILHDEGVTYGRSLDVDMLDGSGGAYFEQQVQQFYAVSRMERHVEQGLRDGMSDADIAQSIAFFDTERGQRILTLETAGRVAIADPEVEEIARAAYADAQGGDDPRLAEIIRFVAVNDLIERNVAGALSSNYHFLRGLTDGGGAEMSDDAILAEVWAQETEVRDDTESWLFGYLMMAYRPLSDADLEAYTEFSGTDAGQALNSALFAGFDKMYRDISYDLGLSVARAMTVQDL